MKLLYVALIGLIFGVGIILSGMADPNKVLNFFDVAGTWDPSLAFVMGGGLLVNLIGYKLTFRRVKPLLAPSFPADISTKIDKRLIGGSVLFGIGWGIAGFCPGAALPALGTLNINPIIFIASVVMGLFIVRLARRYSVQ